MPRVQEISDKFFNRDDAGQTLTEFTDKLIADETRNSAVGVDISIPQDFVVNSSDVYRFLSDRGSGRIYDGLKSLELMSRIIRGVNVQSATLFDNTLIAFTAEDMQGADSNTATKIINSNIGIKEIYDYAKTISSLEVAVYDVFAQKIARIIKAGAFKTEDHIGEALIRVKALIRSVINSKVVR